jgi:alpha-tubulin suppressor-like RCC1 family protein
VHCWGRGESGRLGSGVIGNVGDDEVPATSGDVVLGGSAIQIAAGYEHTCALLTGGAVRCWGVGALGRLGYGNTDNVGVAPTVADAGDVALGGAAIQIAAGGFHTCALLDTGAVRCWGSGTSGRLGYGTTAHVGDDETPAAAGDVTLGAAAIAIAAGSFHTCALLTGGAVRCWGMGSAGRLGYGNTSDIGDNETPGSAGDVPIGGTATAIAAGRAHTCAVLSTGAVRCWGEGSVGQLGNGSTSNVGDNETPASIGDVTVNGAVVASVAAGGYHTCARLDTDEVLCWGRGFSGQLGYGNTSIIGDNEAPGSVGAVPVGGAATAVTTGDSHSCATLATGAVRCWGYNLYGQLGYGMTDNIGDDEAAGSAGDAPVE